MDCEPYRRWIEDEAAEMPGAARRPGVRDLRELKVHLAVCSRCQAAFEQEQSLIAAIDGSLRASLAAEPSPAFAAGVRARLSEARVRPRSWRAGWAPIAAGALAASLVVAVWVGRKQKAEGRGQRADVKQELGVRSQKSEETGVAAATDRRGIGELLARNPVLSTPRRAGLSPLRADHRAESSRSRPNAQPDLEVLVPKGQAAAVMQLYNSVWDAPQEETAAAGVGSQGTVAEATAKPLEIELLKVEPLESGTLEADLARPAPPESGPDGAKGSDR